MLITYLVLHCAAGCLPYQTMWMGFVVLFFPFYVLEVAGRIISHVEVAGALDCYRHLDGGGNGRRRPFAGSMFVFFMANTGRC